MDESVLETDKKKRFTAQGWDALKDSPFFEILWKHRNVFPEEVPSRLPADRGIGHEFDLEPRNKCCVTRQWPLIILMNSLTNESRRDMCVRVNLLTAARTFVCVKPQVVGAWFMLTIS